MDEKKPVSSEQDNVGKETPDMNSAEPPSHIETKLNSMPKSQALLDIEASDAVMDEAKSKKNGASQTASKNAPQNLAAIARFRWILLFVLSLAAIAAWAVEAQIADHGYKFIALGYLAVSLLLTSPAMKFLRIPTRAGLAALLWAGTYFISAIHSPNESLFGGKIPAALPWGGLLIMILLWMTVAVWRKVGRYKVIDIVLAVIIVYAALSPLPALVTGVSSGDVLSMNFQALNSSPFFITNTLPWFLWPMTAALALILPLCALFSLWDQISVLKRRGARHGGNIFLALAFLLIIPYGFIHYKQAVAELPELAAPLAGGPIADIAPPVEPEIPIDAPSPATEPAKPADTEAPFVHEDEAPEKNIIPLPVVPDASSAPSARQQPEAVDKIMELENKLSGANKRIDTLESRLESLSRDLEQLKKGAPPIPAPPLEPPVEPKEPMQAEPGFSAAT